MQSELEISKNLQNAKRKVAGSNKVLRALSENNASCIYLAKDVDNFLSQSIINSAQNANVQVIMVQSRQILAQLCNVNVKTAAAAILKQ